MIHGTPGKNRRATGMAGPSNGGRDRGTNPSRRATAGPITAPDGGNLRTAIGPVKGWSPHVFFRFLDGLDSHTVAHRAGPRRPGPRRLGLRPGCRRRGGLRLRSVSWRRSLPCRAPATAPLAGGEGAFAGALDAGGGEARLSPRTVGLEVGRGGRGRESGTGSRRPRSLLRRPSPDPDDLVRRPRAEPG